MKIVIRLAAAVLAGAVAGGAPALLAHQQPANGAAAGIVAAGWPSCCGPPGREEPMPVN